MSTFCFRSISGHRQRRSRSGLAPRLFSADLKRRPELGPYFAGNDHVYCEIVRWVNANTLLLRVHGYGDKNRKGVNIVRRYQVVQKQ
jgi:hypothetical protein